MGVGRSMRMTEYYAGAFYDTVSWLSSAQNPAVDLVDAPRPTGSAKTCAAFSDDALARRWRSASSQTVRTAAAEPGPKPGPDPGRRQTPRPRAWPALPPAHGAGERAGSTAGSTRKTRSPSCRAWAACSTGSSHLTGLLPPRPRRRLRRPCRSGGRCWASGRVRLSRRPSQRSPALTGSAVGGGRRGRTWPRLRSGTAAATATATGRDQGWRGRGVARVAGRQNAATPAGSRVAKKTC